MNKISVKLLLIIITIVIGIITLIIFGIYGVKNQAIALEEQIGTAASDIEIQEKRRADLIPNLVDCVKAYDKHEYQIMVDVIASRGSSSDDCAAEIQTMINAVAEAYPELKSNSNYKELMNELASTENLIANYRSNYNSWVKDYKKYVRKFPNEFFLSLLGYEVIEYEYLNYRASSDAMTDLFGE